MASKVIHFEIPIDDSERAIGFYGTVFGWELDRFGPVEYWTTRTGEGPGIDGALTARDPDAPGLVFYISVDDVDEALASIEANGGERLSDRIPIPGVGMMAFFADTEGNRVGIFQDDATAPVPDSM